ncbi:hypothetical protein [Rhizobium leguminosarum]|uniref:hypothetical protein n=1 Tax=Rhizobium leguminosarum TaxID=384 RepID=UPI001649A8FE|nr:hypothetical protein [Rhizobium leguminosarum]
MPQHGSQRSGCFPNSSAAVTDVPAAICVRIGVEDFLPESSPRTFAVQLIAMFEGSVVQRPRNEEILAVIPSMNAVIQFPS